MLKSTDMGNHWTVASDGIFDTRIQSIGLVDEKGDHVFCGVPGGIYETIDAAASWKLVNGSDAFGTCYTFKNGTIGNEPYIFAGCDAGIANYAVKTGKWNLIPPGGWGRAGYLTQSDALPNTVLGGCLDGVVTIGEVTSPTNANWTSFKERPCTMLGPYHLPSSPPPTLQDTHHSPVPLPPRACAPARP